jgi:ABC-type lipoprotein release transport system permease subunit
MTGGLEKQRHILDLAISSLRRRVRKNAILLTVYTLIVFCLASVMFYTQTLKREASLVLRGSPELIVQKLMAGRHDLIPLAYGEKIRKIRGVQEVKGRLWGYYYDQTARANYTLLATQGYNLGDGEVAIGAGLASMHGLSRGMRLSFRSHEGQPVDFTIKGIFGPESALVSADLVLMSEAGLRRVFGFPADTATDLVVSVRNQKEIPTIAAKILELLPDSRPISRPEILKTYEAVFDWRGGILLVILAGTVLAFLIFASDRAAGLSAEEKREIGILKGIGWETADILQLKMYEGAVISLFAFLVGTLLAYLILAWTGGTLLAPVLKGWSTLYPKFRLVPHLDAFQLSVLFFLTVIPYTVATIVPSWRAANIDPDLVMRT